MIPFHPYARAFWEPIRAALAAGLFGGAFGLGLGIVDGAPRPWPAALIWAAAAAVIVWTWDHAVWLKILAASYQPIPDDSISDVSADDVEDVPIYMTRCSESATIHLIRDLPVEPALLHEYAQGLAQGRRTTYADWIGVGRPFTQETYLALVMWMRSNRMVSGDPGRTVTLTDQGRDILRDVFERGITLFSPTEIVNTNEI